MTPDFFTHRFVAGSAADGPLLLLLHGTGGNENDLLPLGREVAPAAPLLSPRGRVQEGAQPRFFRRLAEGVFDEEDIRRRAAEFAEWIPIAAAAHGVAGRPVVAAGFSNGANLAAALLLLHPGVLRGALLVRAMVPLTPPAVSGLTGTAVLLLSGMMDPVVPQENSRRLAAMLRRGGAAVTHLELPAGHQLTSVDVHRMAAWLPTALR